MVPSKISMIEVFSYVVVPQTMIEGHYLCAWIGGVLLSSGTQYLSFVALLCILLSSVNTAFCLYSFGKSICRFSQASLSFLCCLVRVYFLLAVLHLILFILRALLADLLEKFTFASSIIRSSDCSVPFQSD